MTEPNGAGKADQADEPETGTEYTAGHEGQAAKDMAQVSGLFEDTQTDLGVLELARILKPINEAHMALRSARLERCALCHVSALWNIVFMIYVYGKREECCPGKGESTKGRH